MTSLVGLLRGNRNYRYMWMGQVVSEAGDYFNNVAVLALVMAKSGSGMVVSGVFLSRAIPAVLAGPIAGVMLDRFDRRRIMMASDLIRAVVAAAFVLTVHQQRPWLLYLLSATLMFVSPFFTAGRAAILPSIATQEEIHAANSLTQTTSWATLTAGTLLGGLGAEKLGYDAAFVLNAVSFLFSAWCIWRMAWRPVPSPAALKGSGAREFVDGLRYIGSVPLMVGIAMISFGWALGGGAAQVLFALFGEQVFHRGAAGIGDIWGFAGIGLLAGGAMGHVVGRRAGFRGYKRAVTVSYLVHGAAYMLFSQTGSFGAALVLMTVSRVGMAVTSVLNNSQLLRHAAAQYRGRVFATLEALRNAVMIVSMAAAGIASQYAGPRTIGLVAGACGTLTALVWAWMDATGHLPEPEGKIR
ncbi:Major facilitator superfamily MFS_1 [Candidatus Sulfopaludibacter sp. SbA3]|nr:Major facilitator superfamily MFS_1 [Candidatus Sulfopaludibacter sp. SbA3]